MKLWIPGARGLLGSALMNTAQMACVGTGREEADIGDLDSLRRFVRSQPGITHIVNCAAFSLVDASETRKEEAHLANSIGPENLGRIAREIRARLVHISTDYVFPGDLMRPLTETDPVGPCNTYGKTKLEGEQRLLSIFPEACILRVSWLFGSGGKNFVSKLLSLLQEPGEIRLTNDQWGRPTYVPDLAIVALQMFGRAGIYHFANSGVATKYEFGIAMRELALQQGIAVRAKAILPVPGASFSSPCKRPVYSAFDTSKIERALGIVPRDWQTTLSEFMVRYAPAAL